MKAPSFAPAGQSTQMIAGATPATDRTILDQASSMYREHRLRRVYYSAFSLQTIATVHPSTFFRAPAAAARADACELFLRDLRFIASVRSSY